jgi:hypothetical protein
MHLEEQFQKGQIPLANVLISPSVAIEANVASPISRGDTAGVVIQRNTYSLLHSARFCELGFSTCSGTSPPTRRRSPLKRIRAGLDKARAFERECSINNPVNSVHSATTSNWSSLVKSGYVGFAPPLPGGGSFN